MKNNVVTIEQDNNQTPDISNSNELIFNGDVMARMQSLAEIMASGKCTVPKHLQGSVGDCFAIIMQSARWKMDPYVVGQKTHLINGTLGYEAQLVNAVVSSSRAIQGRFKYEYQGDWSKHNVKGSDAAIRVGAVIHNETEITWGEWLNVGDVTVKNSPLWKTAPKQQAAYLVVKYWARMYCPEVLLGVYTADELETIPEKEINPIQKNEQTTSRVNAVKQKMKAKVENQPVNETSEDEITLDSVLSQMDEAKNNDQLALAADLANTLEENDKQVAREEYKSRYVEINGGK